jgi:elongation factor Ts
MIKKERDIATAAAAESGKPPNIVEKMIEGGVQKFLKSVSLLGQAFVKNDKQSVEAVLKSHGASISDFVLYVVGEGIEKKSSDFAAEVRAQVSSASSAKSH